MEKHILVLTHGDFGESLLRSAQMIIGEVTEVTSVSLTPEDSGDTFYEKIEQAIAGISKEIICLVDMFGGSPCTTALRLSKNRSITIICGLNLPMFIELYNQLSMDEEMDNESLIKITRENIFDVTKKVFQ